MLVVLSFFAVLGTCVVGDGPYVWPLPSQYTINDTPNLYVAADFAFETESNSDIITEAIRRYQRLTFPHVAENNPPDNVQILQEITIEVTSTDETLDYGMDESYTISFPDATKAQLKANTVWGALRGLETFSQLIIYDFVKGYYVGFEATIDDEPRFSHRGLLIDTSRHFQSVESIRHMLDSMSYAKLNVLHWHIVDSQSFPYESKAYPNLWNGAYTPYERYSQNDVKEVVEHARYLGIRVIPEFDMPGHAQSWCVGYPEICPSPSCTSPLNPAVDDTWNLIDGLIAEAYKGLFTDTWIHLGGDEVSTKCWETTPSIEQWMQDNNLTSRATYGYFVKRAMNISYYKYDLQVINWVEVFNNFNTTLNRNVTVIEVWKSKKMLAAAVEDGFRAILADSDLWYLDHLSITWDKMYMNEPFEDIDDPAQQALVLGGETCMWGETVDVSDIQNTVWPRAAAVAERLWSPQSVNDTKSAQSRIEYFRCLLNERGIAAAPVNNAQARSAPPGPGSCYSQRRR